jgi:hypothetical protein
MSLLLLTKLSYTPGDYMKCIECNNHLIGKQTKFCSQKCKGANANNRHQSYAKQKERAKKRKIMLIEKLGGKCKYCGYAKNYASLAFHHVDGKDFSLDARRLSNSTINSILKEANRCELVCHNCHMEIHHPDCLL